MKKELSLTISVFFYKVNKKEKDNELIYIKFFQDSDLKEQRKRFFY
ncbi:MAG: hypothetical protein K1X92_00355 [Bacteroidia bacterium]|nr:hypothetical protein [Bacteroidia bacterium]